MKAAALEIGLEQLGDVEHVLLDLGIVEDPLYSATIEQLRLDKLRRVSVPESVGCFCDHRFVAAVAKAIASVKPDIVAVYGDLDGSVTAAIAARTLGLRVCHIESGLTNRDLQDPEEQNRRVLERLADLRTTHSSNAYVELANVHGGSTVLQSINPITALVDVLASSEKTRPSSQRGGYVLATVHRSETLDNRETLLDVIEALAALARERPVKLVGYPDTQNALDKHLLTAALGQVEVVPFQTFSEYIRTLANATLVVTDSSGVLDESVHLGVPAGILRIRTHRTGHSRGVATELGLSTSEILSGCRRLLRSSVVVDHHRTEKEARIHLRTLAAFVAGIPDA